MMTVGNGVVRQVLGTDSAAGSRGRQGRQNPAAQSMSSSSVTPTTSSFSDLSYDVLYFWSIK
jgi:hypothetical protein